MKSLSRSPLTRYIVNLVKAVTAILLIETLVFNWKFWISLAADYSSPSGAVLLSISKVRIVLMLAIYLLYVIFRPSSHIWDIKMNSMSRKSKVALSSFVILISLLSAGFTRITNQGEWLDAGAQYNTGIEAVQDGNQYNHLTDALLNGKVELDLPVSDILLEMDNPYDPAERAALNSEIHDSIYWDYAFYGGNYYCYFGIIPCLLTFLPFKIITGVDLRTDIVVAAFAITTVLSSAYLLIQVGKTYFSNLTVGNYLVGFILLTFGCGVFEQAFLPRIYPIPILSALTFSFLGIAFWLKAKRHFTESRDRYKYLLMGSFSLAFTLGCRPQYVLACLLAFPIFKDEIGKRLFFSYKGLSNTLAVIAPFLIIFLPIGFYNYIRFDSITNFGAAYNLTGGDMTSYRFIPFKILVQFVEYLFLPFQFTSSFPFITVINNSPLSSNIESLKTAEPFYAGFMFLTPITFSLFALVRKAARTALKDSGCSPLLITSLAIAAFNIVVASYVSGTNMRYFADFAWLIILSAILVLWSSGFSRSSRGRVFISILLFAGLALYGWTFLGVERFGALIQSCPEIYSAVQNAIFSALP